MSVDPQVNWVPPWREIAADSSLPLRSPWQFTDVRYVMVGARFPESVVRSLMPAGIEPAETMSGGFCFCVSGDTANPYNKSGAWLDVKGFDGPDGTRGRLVLRVLATGTLADCFRQHRLPTGSGSATLSENANGTTLASGHARGRPTFDAVVRDTGRPARPAAYYHYYLGVSDGELGVLPLAVSNLYVEAEPLSLVNRLPASDPLSVLKPQQFLWAAHPRDGMFTFGSPVDAPDKLVAEAYAAGVDRVLDVIGGSGLAGFWLDRRGEVVTSSQGARQLLGEEDGLCQRGNRLVPTDRAAVPAFERLLAVALARPADPAELGPVALGRTARKPLLAQAIPLAQDFPVPHHRFLPRRREVLLLITDPDRPIRGDVARALQLLGLSRAEARIAALVGSGLSPAATAERLGLSEGATRVSLTRAYSKLSISRQSELARLVARVEAVG